LEGHTNEYNIKQFVGIINKIISETQTIIFNIDNVIQSETLSSRIQIRIIESFYTATKVHMP